MSIHDPNWRYKPSFATDIRKTIAREKKRLKDAATQPPAQHDKYGASEQQPALGRFGGGRFGEQS
jgi:hypothetical protein